MSVDAFFERIDPDPRARLTRLAWRAELLAEIEEKFEQVARRFEADGHPETGLQVARMRKTAERLKELADRHAVADLTEPVEMAALTAALSSATAAVRAMEERGASGAGPAEPAG